MRTRVHGLRMVFTCGTVACLLFLFRIQTVSAQDSIYASASVLFLDNGAPNRGVVSQHLSIVPGSAWLFTDSADFGTEPGMEFKLGKFLDELTVIEGSYFGLHQWSASASVVDPTEGLFAPFSNAGVFLDDFSQAFRQGFTTSSEVHNVELNLRRQLTDPIWLLVGLRYLSYREQFRFFSQDDPDPASDIGRYNVDTENHALGLQIGVEPTYLLLDWLEVGASIKTGLFANMVSQESRLINDNSVFAAGSSDATSATGMFDLNLRASIVHGNWRFSAGYRAMLMSGMARAADQLDWSINEDPDAVVGNVNHEGSVLLHGPWAGVSFVY